LRTLRCPRLAQAKRLIVGLTSNHLGLSLCTQRAGRSSHHRRADDIVPASAMTPARCSFRCGRGIGMVIDKRDGAFC